MANAVRVAAGSAYLRVVVGHTNQLPNMLPATLRVTGDTRKLIS